ncbi:hypothetical protein QJS04_geneDACA023264 [Acorus gramineus]|uniref:RING-type domain-containing protein n=1 Tax=Acorus gramineus TaxID=55184 RepID=A0AAV9BHH1_ACOGR|nr:hypothetical protein QJS04_geneDACA023264 [Acorus gramineus]
MAGNSDGIKIPAVFVSKDSGEMLKKYADVTPMELWIIPTFENSAWSIMAISFISLLAMSAVLATCFFVRRQRVRRERSRTPRFREFHGMSDNSVKAMPSLIFTSALEDNCTSTTCAICLEDYNIGEKLRVLPCRHKFHAFCVDSWLTSWRSFCPVCKRDARTSTGDPPPSESTPLLLSRPSSPSTSHALSSFRSSISSSPPIQIIPRPPRAPSISASPAVNIAPSISHSPSSFRTHSYSSTPHAHSYSSTPHAPHLLRSYGNSPAMVHSRSTTDFRSASSHRSRDSFLVPSHSFGVPYSSSPLSRYPSPYAPSYLGSSSREQQLLLHYSRSNASISPFASGHSLPGC